MPVEITSVQSTEKKFNHDLLVNQEDITLATLKWPNIYPLLVNQPLVVEFQTHDHHAKTNKRRVHWLGTLSVMTASVSLLGTIFSDVIPLSDYDSLRSTLLLRFEMFGLIAIFLAYLASRFGPFRRRWLRSRFISEVLRQWHFRSLWESDLKRGQDISSAVKKRDKKFLKFITSLRGSVGAKMDQTIDNGYDAISEINPSSLPFDKERRREMLNAFKELRLDHQVEYATHKLSPDDKSFFGISLASAIWLTDTFAGASFIIAVGFSTFSIFFDSPFGSQTALTLLVIGITVRAWRDGVAIGNEKERFQEILNRLTLLRDKWMRSSDEAEQLCVSKDIEVLMFEEMRRFLRDHNRAQFIV